MHDTLSYIGKDPIYRGYHHNQMTFSLMYAFSENFVLPISHDEVVHGKGSLWERMPGDAWNKAANVRALLAYMWAHPGKQLLFMGSEFGQSREWSEERSLDWDLLGNPLHGGIKSLVGDLNRVYKDTPALYTRDNTPEGFSWIDANDAAGNVLSFLRHGVDADGKPTVLACVANFSGGPRDDYRVGLPFAGRWREVLNTDAEIYGGSGVGNLGVVEAEPQMWHGRPASAALRLPPSGVLWLAPERAARPGRRRTSGRRRGGAVRPGGRGRHHPGRDRARLPRRADRHARADQRRRGGRGQLDRGRVDIAYAVDDDDAAAPSRPPTPTSTPGTLPSATDADAPHFPDDARPRPWRTTPSCSTRHRRPGSARPLPWSRPRCRRSRSRRWATTPDQVPPDAAAEDEPPAMELTPGGGEAVLDEPRSGSDVTETTVAVGSSAGAAAMPSATRPADRDDGTGARGAST